MQRTEWYPIKLRAGTDKPCQLVLMKLTSALPLGEQYGTKPTHLFQLQDSPLPTKKKKK